MSISLVNLKASLILDKLSCRLNCRKETSSLGWSFLRSNKPLSSCKDCSQIRKFCVREHHPRWIYIGHKVSNLWIQEPTEYKGNTVSANIHVRTRDVYGCTNIIRRHCQRGSNGYQSSMPVEWCNLMKRHRILKSKPVFTSQTGWRQGTWTKPWAKNCNAGSLRLTSYRRCYYPRGLACVKISWWRWRAGGPIIIFGLGGSVIVAQWKNIMYRHIAHV